MLLKRHRNDGEIVFVKSQPTGSDDDILVESSEPEELISEQCISKDKEEM